MIDRCAAAFREEFRWLHHAIGSKTESEGSKAIQFAASQSGEGVTTVTLAFAAFLVEVLGFQKVAVVEANLRQPSFRKLFDLHSTAGLQSVLDGVADLDEALVQLDSRGISVLAADGSHAATATFSSKWKSGEVGSAVSGLIRELRKKFRFVLVDSAPIIPYLDGCTLGSETDGVVFVVESNATRAEVVDRALEKLKSSGNDILGIVLNKRVFNIPQFLYRFL